MVDQSVDLLVVGGGVMGLWAARRGVEAGLSTTLLALGQIGRSGASAGPLGALMPHAPVRWGALAAFQFEALVELEAETARLEAETGRATGYRRVGRVAPLRTAEAAAEATEAAAAARMRWRSADGRAFRVRQRPVGPGDWIDAAAAPFGVRVDDLTARIQPRAYLAALKASLGGRAEVVEGVELVGWDGAARLSDGRRVAAGAVVLAAGAASFALLARLAPDPPPAPRGYGRGIKGQAVVFEPPAARRAEIAGGPVHYDAGLYVIGHSDGRVAVGATTESDWSAPDQPDGAAAALAARARAFAPGLLAGAAPTRFWAGLRPRTASRQPAVGRWPSRDTPLWLLTGGYKISFGVAHRAAAALIGGLTGALDAPRTPEAFDPARALAPQRGSQ